MIWLHSSRRNPTFLQKDIVLFGSPITPVNVVRNLGVILDENMTKSEHIARVCRNCYYQLRQIRRIKRSLTANSITLLVLASVHSRLDYCNSVKYSLPWSRLQLLQSVLNSAARLIRGLKRFDHISPVLIELHWLPYPQRVKYKVCMLMFKCLKGLAPAYLVAFCTKGSSIILFLVGRLWDPLFVGILLCLATGRIGVWEPLLLLVPAVGTELSTRPDPTWQNVDPTRPAVADQKSDPTRPDPTRGPILPPYV